MTQENPQYTRTDGNTEYERALDSLFALPGRTLRIFDRRLSSAYNAPAREQLIKAFLSSNRLARLQIVIHETATLQRDCPRLMNLLRRFSYAIQIQETEARAKAASDPFAVLDERHYVHRFHFDGPRGVLAINDSNGALPLLHRFDEIWEASVPAVAATTLGL